MGRDSVVDNKWNGHKCSMMNQDKGERKKREVAGGEGNHEYIPKTGGDVGKGLGFDTEV